MFEMEIYMLESKDYSVSKNELTTAEIREIRADYEQAKKDLFMKKSPIFICIDWSITLTLLDELMR